MTRYLNDLETLVRYSFHVSMHDGATTILTYARVGVGQWGLASIGIYEELQLLRYSNSGVDKIIVVVDRICLNPRKSSISQLTVMLRWSDTVGVALLWRTRHKPTQLEIFCVFFVTGDRFGADVRHDYGVHIDFGGCSHEGDTTPKSLGYKRRTEMQEQATITH